MWSTYVVSAAWVSVSLSPWVPLAQSYRFLRKCPLIALLFILIPSALNSWYLGISAWCIAQVVVNCSVFIETVPKFKCTFISVKEFHAMQLVLCWLKNLFWSPLSLACHAGSSVLIVLLSLCGGQCGMHHLRLADFIQLTLSIIWDLGWPQPSNEMQIFLGLNL